MKTIKTVVFKGKLLTVVREKKRFPNGYIGSLEVVKHPGAALIAPFLSKHKIILLRQFRPVINSYIYELPAGTLGYREAPIKCAKREIIEETGYTAKRFTRLGHIIPVPGYSTEKITIFKAEILVKVKRDVQEDEVIKVFIITKNKIKALFRAGKIVDAKTICALTLCGWL